jgi:hypothetical protein
MSAVVDITRKEIPVIKIRDGENEYSLPLGGVIPPERLESFRTLQGFMAFLKEHIPADVVDEFGTDQIRAIMTAWSDETKKDTGLTPGESSASHVSKKKTARR